MLFKLYSLISTMERDRRERMRQWKLPIRMVKLNYNGISGEKERVTLALAHIHIHTSIQINGRFIYKLQYIVTSRCYIRYKWVDWAHRYVFSIFYSVYVHCSFYCFIGFAVSIGFIFPFCFLRRLLRVRINVA